MFVPSDVSRAIEERDFADSRDFEDAIGGGIETIVIRDRGVSFYVNDDSLAGHLRINMRAVVLWWLWCPEARGLRALFGDVVIVSAANARGHAEDVTAECRRKLLGENRFSVEFRLSENGRWCTAGRIFDDYISAGAWGLTIVRRCKWACDVRIVALGHG